MGLRLGRVVAATAIAAAVVGVRADAGDRGVIAGDVEASSTAASIDIGFRT